MFSPGVLKAPLCGTKPPQNRIVKDVVAFDAHCFHEVVAKLQLDLHEPPTSQVGLLFICIESLNLLFKK